ncbi:MAG: PAS domain-containing protein [candidate division Zixibacteria bacterium]|nr:PAS domain-containing protein [candidate division Zixibacteria bacterium]
MKKKRLIWQLFPMLWLITILSILVITIYLSHSFKEFYLEKAAIDLRTRAILVKNQIPALMVDGNHKDIDLLCKQLGGETNTRITIILPSGKVIGDSYEEPKTMDNHAHRAEIISALAGDIGISTRYSYTLHKNLMYVAMPIFDNNDITAVVRVSIPISAINKALDKVYIKVTLGGIAIAIFIIGASVYTSRRVSMPIKQMGIIARQFAEGKLSQRIPEHNSIEMDKLSDVMNQMAKQLDYKIQTVVKQRNEQEAILSSMVEGVLAVDLDEKIININKTAEHMLGVSVDTAAGCYIHEVVRNTYLHKFIKKALMETHPLEDELTLYNNGQRSIQVHGNVLHDADMKHIGAVIVLNDITRLRQLENIRRDFVANVSHELKTPITSIKGFVETLIDGAINEPQEASRFLKIIIKHTDRLNAIIEDLLKLSRIEQEYEKAEIEFKEEQLKKTLQASIQFCETSAQAKDINIELICDGSLKVKINFDIFQQAVVNLLDNAIKYSPQGSDITVKAAIEENELVIKIIDKGCGIPKEHHPRLFERFYRVDKERSRELGGTGLGLAIVKHIVLVHNGKVRVESAPGSGSTFAIHLPMITNKL